MLFTLETFLFLTNRTPASSSAGNLLLEEDESFQAEITLCRGAE